MGPVGPFGLGKAKGSNCEASRHLRVTYCIDLAYRNSDAKLSVDGTGCLRCTREEKVGRDAMRGQKIR